MDREPQPNSQANEQNQGIPKKRSKIFALLSGVAAEKAKSGTWLPDFVQEYDKYVCWKFSESELDQLSPTKFWKENAKIFPIFAVLARKHLGMPATSGSVERLFSIAGSINRVQRSGLKVDTIEKVLCLRDDWL